MIPGRPAAATTISAPAHVSGQVDRAGVAEGDRGVLRLPSQQQPERAADGDSPPDHHDLGPGDRDVVSAQQLHDAGRRARQRRLVTEHQPAQVGGVQPVGVLGRIHQPEHAVLVAAAGQRQLHDVAGAARVGVQRQHRLLDLGLGRRLRGGPRGSTRSRPRRSPGACRRRTTASPGSSPTSTVPRPGTTPRSRSAADPDGQLVLDRAGGGGSVECLGGHGVISVSGRSGGCR